MGWCSATVIFDEAISAMFDVLKATGQITNTIEMLHSVESLDTKIREAIVEYAGRIAKELEEGDWDCQRESAYFESLGPYIWPQWFTLELYDEVSETNLKIKQLPIDGFHLSLQNDKGWQEFFFTPGQAEELADYINDRM